MSREHAYASEGHGRLSRPVASDGEGHAHASGKHVHESVRVARRNRKHAYESGGHTRPSRPVVPASRAFARP